jgi:serine/threonine-protein kinase HipA
MMRRAIITVKGINAGLLIEDEHGYEFVYEASYAEQAHAQPVSLTLPIRREPYRSERDLFPFFDGLIPEGWLLDIAELNWKVNPRDRMGLLLACCRDCIGDVGVEEITEVQS